MKYQDKLNLNAETEIDYTKKSVVFSYPNKEAKEDYRYFMHNIVQYIWLITTAGIAIYYANLNGQTTIQAQIYGIVMMTFFSLTTLYLLGLTSIALHKTIPKLREIYPETNAWTLFRKQWKVTDLSSKTQEDWTIYKNTMYNEYNPVYFEYKYIGDNKITKIKTFNLRKEPQKEGRDWTIIIEFENEITDGIFMYKD